MTMTMHNSDHVLRGQSRRPWKRVRIAVTTTAAVSLMTLASVTGTSAATNDTTVTHTAVTWTISGGPNCSQLPDGEVITGEGTITNRIVSHTGGDGLTRVQWYQIANGSAQDLSGRHYRWVYANHENIVNSHANLGLYTGAMSDSFKLVGGPLAFSNGFTANVEDNLLGTYFVIHPISVTGDPIAFPSGPGRCDPI